MLTAAFSRNRLITRNTPTMSESVPPILKNSSIRLLDHNVYMLDSKGYIKSWNTSVEDSQGFRPEHFLGKYFSVFYPEEEREVFRPEKNLQAAALKGYIEEEGWRIQGTEKIWAVASITALYDEQGNLSGYVKIIRDKSEDKMHEEQIIRQAFYDSLTDLPNRTLFEDRLNFLIQRAKRKEEKLGLLFLDLDFFKNINDSLGHKIGDLVLKEVGKRLLESVRAVDTVARFGGDEFMVVLSDVHASEDCVLVAQKILASLKKVIKINSFNLYLTASMGIAMFPYDGVDADTLLKNADTALHKVKEAGRGDYGFYSQTMSLKLSQKINFESGMRDALQNNELVMHYQPIIDVETNTVIAAEALARWNHPQLGFLLPGEFLPVIEDSEVFFDFCDWALQTACVQNKEWQDKGMPSIRVAVNISVRQLVHSKFTEKIAKALESSGLDPKYLELEITETAAMQNIEHNFKVLQKLKDMGTHITIDDFGIGHSSLSYLKNFPIDTIKIDKSFIRESIDHKEDLAIIKAILTLAEGLKLKVVAEGVETKEQLEHMLALGCRNIQGFLFSIAVSPQIFFENHRNNFLL